ncbi:hypothetical protein TW95_gp0955 [Pandoravirus inopinatum]|uniref:Transmembrane protein n=1 Tax=Pandoravirus inopinatum TaxID=1605721 RepID=A0A0B5J2C9_9VIRU|nr:hypothetical protein TW95_gp0955 [Pandoravirus inopinatum]AJF97689.1 hypothetical protein [Pandoravirus inopinatum]
MYRFLHKTRPLFPPSFVPLRSDFAALFLACAREHKGEKKRAALPQVLNDNFLNKHFLWAYGAIFFSKKFARVCSDLCSVVGALFFCTKFFGRVTDGAVEFLKKKRPTQQGRQSRVRRRLTHKDARRADQKRSRRNMSVAALKNSNLSIILVFAFLIPLSFSVLWCLGVASQKRVCRDDFLLVGKNRE